MSEKKCPSAEELKAYALGQLRAEEIDEVAGHVDACPPCEDTVAALEIQGDTVVFGLRTKARSEVARDGDLQRALSFVRQIGQQSAASAKSKESAPPIGHLREYELLEKLGEGGMGAVYKARHSKLDKIVAIKVLPADKMRDEQAVARFEREMRAVGKLEHPNIVRAMDAGEVDGMHFLVMEYVKGLDLSQISKQHGPLAVADACELIRQSAVGLDEAFDNDMVHRDIKPSNLILAERRRKPTIVKILDMGLALLSDAHAPNVEGLTSTGQTMGTLDYMAPEQGGNSKNVDIRADIYALGASLYRLLCGEVIYHGESYQSPVQKMMALAVEPAPPIQNRVEGIPDELATIIHKMLEKSPSARYATPQEVVDALEPYCAGHDLEPLLTAGHDNQPLTDTTFTATELGALSGEADTDPVGTGCQPVPESQIDSTSAYPSAATIASPTSFGKPQAASGTGKLPVPTWIAGSAGLLGIVALLAAMVFYFQTPHGTLRVEINDSDIEVKVKDSDIVLTNADKEPIKLKAGEHTLIVTRGDFTFETKQFELKKGEATTVRVELLSGKVQVVSAGSVIGSRAIEGDNPADTIVSDAHALRFDGNEVVKVGEISIDSDVSVTVEAWIKPRVRGDGVTGGSPVFFYPLAIYVGKMVGDRVQIHAHSHYFTPGKGGWLHTHDTGYVPPRGEIENQWIHLAATLDPQGSIGFYINGKLAGVDRGEFTWPVDTPAKKVEPRYLQFGSDYAKSPHFIGDIREVRISTGLRYAQDFTPPPCFTSDKQTLAVYHFDEGSGDVLRDSSGNNHHGKIVGAKWVRVSDDTAHDPERRAAEWAISVGGKVMIGDQWIDRPQLLPAEGFAVERIDISSCAVADDDFALLAGLAKIHVLAMNALNVGDEALEHVAELESLAEIHAADGSSSRPRFTDAGVAWIAQLPRLKVIYIHAPSLSDESLRHLLDRPLASRLRHISIRGDGITDEGLGVLEGQSQLEIVHVGSTQITDHVFEHIAQLPNLVDLTLESPMVTGTGLTKLGDRPKLRALTLRNCPTTNNALASLSQFPGLRGLGLDESMVTDAGLDSVVQLRLAVLSLKRTKVTDVGLAKIAAEMPRLQYLDLDGVIAITDKGLSHIAGMKALRQIRVHETRVTAQGVARLLQALPDCVVLSSFTDEEIAVAMAKTNPDRAAAEWLIAGGGFVQVYGGSPAGYRAIGAIDDLPSEEFHLRAASFRGMPRPTAAQLAILAACPRLRILSCDGSPIVDEDLRHFQDCQELREVDLNKTNVTDAGLEHLENLRPMKLRLSHCQITGTGFVHLRHLSELVQLALHDSPITDESLNHFRGAEKLRVLDLHATGVTDAGLAHFQGAKELESLHLWDTAITDEGLAHFANCERLSFLTLTSTAITDAGLAHLERLPLESLNIAGTQVTDAGLERLQKLPLTALFVARTKVTPEALKAFSKALPNCRIHWDDGVIGPPAGVESERAAAEYVQSQGGKVGTKDDPFRVEWVSLEHVKGVTDEGLAVFQDCESIESLNLRWTDSTDAALDHFRNCRNLNSLSIGPTSTDAVLEKLPQFEELAQLNLTARADQITTEGLKHLRDCKNLTNVTLTWSALIDESAPEVKNWRQVTHLSLLETKFLTDQGLAHLKECKQLQFLRITKTSRLSDQMLEELKAALPDCEIRIDGLLVEPVE